MNWATVRPTSGDHNWRAPIGALTNLPRDARLAALGQRRAGAGGEVDREEPRGAAVLAGHDARGPRAGVGQLTVERDADGTGGAAGRVRLDHVHRRARLAVLRAGPGQALPVRAPGGEHRESVDHLA